MTHPYPEFSSTRILIADDDSAMAGIMANLVRSRIGCEVETVYDGDATLAAQEARPADIVLADMVMPGVNGLELLTRIVSRWPDTDVVVVTGHSDSFPYVSVINAGAKDFISKPFPNAELEAKLIRILRERSSREAQLQAESTYRSIFELNTNGMIFLRNDTLTIEDANGVFCELTGFARETLLGKPITEVFSSREQQRLHDGLGLCQQAGKGTLGDLVLVRASGQEIVVDISVTMLAGSAPRLACLSFKDTTERHEIDNSLAHEARIDALTGLFNRRMFNAALERAVERASRGSGALSLMFIDLDNFKQCNDTHGHAIGDKVLQTVSDVIRSSVRHGKDDGFRCGGDEFAVVLSETDPHTASLIGERVRKAFEGIENYGTSLSIGIAAYKPGMGPQALAQAADELLYQAKAQGKNALCVA